jgi:hypothetical protein
MTVLPFQASRLSNASQTERIGTRSAALEWATNHTIPRAVIAASLITEPPINVK